jgi:hypothetical protein
MALAGLGWVLLLAGAFPTAGSALECLQPAIRTSLEEGSVASIDVAVTPGQAWALRIDELGLDAELSLDGRPFEAISLRPPRRGATLRVGQGPARVAARTATGRSGEIGFTLDCAAQAVADAACWSAVEAAWAAQGGVELRQLASHGGICGALAAHALATVLSRQARFADALQGYADVAAAWEGQNQPERAALARLGRSEQLLYLSQYDRAVLESARSAVEFAALGDLYFAARSEINQANALGYLGNFEQAVGVLEHAETTLAALAEWGEVANVRYNIASLQRSWGDREAARQTLQSTQQLPLDKATPTTRGRLALLSSELAMLDGEPAVALRRLAEADSALQAGQLQRWQTRASLLRAEIVSGLGMPMEAYAALSEAARIIDVRHAPIDFAHVLAALGKIELEMGRDSWAAYWAAAATSQYALLGLGAEQAQARLLRLRAEPTATADELEALRNEHAQIERNPWFCLVRARGLLQSADPKAAMSLLESAACRVARLDAALQRLQLRADAWTLLGQPERGRAEIESTASALRSLAEGSRPALYFSLLRQGRVLRDALAARSESTLEMVEVERWLDLALRTHPFDLPTEPTRAPVRVSSHIGAVLLAGAEALVRQEQDAALAILAKLGSDDGHAASAAPWTAPGLAAIQNALPADTWWLLVVPAEPSSVGLWISRDRVALTRLPARSILEQASNRLLLALQPPASTGEAIHEAAEVLSDSLLGDAPTATAPARLWVLADESLGTVPLALLRWPGSSSPLLYTTATSWITGLHSIEEQQPRPLTAAVAIVSAEGVGPGMPNLPQAEREPRLIAEQLHGVALQSWLGPDATVEKLLSALSDPAAIVHIGAHGEAAPSLLGHAGVWLSASSDQPSDRFLSWLDIVDQPVRAGLVVLNACQLASNSVGSRGTLNFASSLSGVGASQVIAAFWPVSDAATAIWVPSFYAHLRPDTPESAAEALRQAQLALARSPRFSHPFHWASMRHFQRLPLRRQRDETRPSEQGY